LAKSKDVAVVLENDNFTPTLLRAKAREAQKAEASA